MISLAATEKLFEVGKAQNVLILVPTSLDWQWVEKIEEFTDTPYQWARAKHRASRGYIPLSVPNYWVVPYSLVRKDYDIIKKQNWDVVIADEAQEFKNNTAKISQLVKRLNVERDPDYRWALTGTAISTKLEELFSIFYWIDPSYLPSWPTFEKTHIVRNELGIIYKYKNLKGLNEYLQYRMDRRTHADLRGKIPRVLPQTIKVEPDKAYLVAQEKLLGILDRMATNLSFDEDGNLQGVRRDSAASKAFSEVRQALPELKFRTAVATVKRILEENPDNRIVLFSFYKLPLYTIQQALPADTVVFTGDQSSEEKRAAIKVFSEGQRRVLLASNAGSTGLDLPFANYTIHMDIPFSYAVLDQRNKRTTRANSKFSHVVSIYLVVDNSIEDYYYQTVLNRERLAKATFEGGEDEVVIRTTSLRSHIRGDDDDGKTTTRRNSSVPRAKQSAKGKRKTTQRTQHKNQGRNRKAS